MKTTITPEMAANFLENNPNNRNVNKRQVQFLTNEILNDNFVFNGESIIIGDDGRLLDGQHRLHAIIQANKPIEAILVEGVPVSAMVTIDTGKARTASDVFKMNSVKNSISLSSGIRGIFEGVGKRNMHHRGIKTRIIRTSNTEIFDFYNEHEEALTILSNFLVHIYNSGTKIMTVSEMIGFSWLLGKEDPEKVIDFFREVILGVRISESNCAHLLRDRLINNKIAGKTDRKDRTEFIIKTFRQYLSGDVRKHLSMAKGEMHMFMEDDIHIEPKFNLARIVELTLE